MTQLNPSTLQEREFIAAICDLLNNNVIIPIGSNRHPYADVLHQWLENTELCLQQNIGNNGYFVDCYLETHPYRIKSSEPVYEYQFSINISGVILTSEYMTQEEWSSSEIMYVSRRNEETKRERQ